MTDNDALPVIQMPVQVWIEIHADDPHARDIIVAMEDGTIFNAVFVTPDYIANQMDLTHAFCTQIEDTIPSRFATLDVPHVVVESLERDFIEDTIDNILAMGVFESVFTQVTDPPPSRTTPTTTNGHGRRATQEVAAVVLSDVLVVED